MLSSQELRDWLEAHPEGEERREIEAILRVLDSLTSGKKSS